MKNILKKVKEKKIDLLIDLQNSTRTEIYNLFIKIFAKCKILSARKFSDYKYKQKKLGVQHITKNHQDQLKYLEINTYLKPDLSWMLKGNTKQSKKGRSYVKKNYSSDLMCKKTLGVYNHLVNS